MTSVKMCHFITQTFLSVTWLLIITKVKAKVTLEQATMAQRRE